ncbi:hypothetical protein O6H91_07G040300 [Diphasiastrum complanatum]|uniref:Uncharacterized protein n=1 Tax=Diphasiastrum complanatum TaxID=34168 RepID=A0ACC2D4F9_DIPCM|nr:hypothetical protein O6H91_07G040300 [Diphasiastrum complanatum]
MDSPQPPKGMDYSEPDQIGLEAWEYDSSNEDQELPHKYSPNRPVATAHIHELGVLNWKLDILEWHKNPLLEEIKKNRGYNYSEILTLSQHETENFEEKVKGFFQEHMHSQEEIRLILDGSGYWDIRDYDEKWLRFRVTKGDLIVLPPGMFHRFTLDEAKYIKALLLYTEVPCRTQHERTEDESTARKLYVDTFLNKRMAIHETQMAVHETQMAALTV